MQKTTAQKYISNQKTKLSFICLFQNIKETKPTVIGIICIGESNDLLENSYSFKAVFNTDKEADEFINKNNNRVLSQKDLIELKFNVLDNAIQEEVAELELVNKEVLF